MACCAGRKPWNQLFFVMRHAERLDFADEEAWFQDPASQVFPMDPPITKTGWHAAREQGKAITELCDRFEACVDIIVTSPYHRCVQTAVALLEVLPQRGSRRVPILLDAELGEVGVYRAPAGISDPALLAKHKEICGRRRSFEEVAALADLEGVQLINRDSFVGLYPPFPEERRAAHMRGLYRFAEWLERGRHLNLNILVVTHQDLVHIFCSMIKPEFCIEWVKYCGWGSAVMQRPSRCLSTSWMKRGNVLNELGSPPPALHTLSIHQAELGPGIRRSKHEVDRKSGSRLRWLPFEDERGVAAEAARIAHLRAQTLQDLNAYAAAQAEKRFQHQTTSVLFGSFMASSRDVQAVSDIEEAYKLLLQENSEDGNELPPVSEEDLEECRRGAQMVSRRTIDPISPKPVTSSAAEFGCMKKLISL